MATVKTEGVVLKRSNFGEAGRLLTVITPYKGKVKVLAKGVRKITSRRSGNVEILNRVKLYLFIGKEFYTLTEAESIETYQNIKSDLIVSAYASHLIELIDRLIPQEQSNPMAYQLLVATLELLNHSPRQIFIRAFEVKLLTTLGFWDIKDVEVTSETHDLLEQLRQGNWAEIEQMKLNEKQALELERLLRYYIEKVLESPLRSAKIIQKLKIKS